MKLVKKYEVKVQQGVNAGNSEISKATFSNLQLFNDNLQIRFRQNSEI